jgi:hypothetical protein
MGGVHRYLYGGPGYFALGGEPPKRYGSHITKRISEALLKFSQY